MAKDMTKKKIKAGVACLGCTVDHALTSTEAICEASRMVSGRGLRHKQITDRLCDATRQFNVCERFDLSDAQILKLPKREQNLAKWMKRQSSILRHDLKTVRTEKALSNLCAKADKFSKNAFYKMMRLNVPVACPVKRKKR